VKITYKSNT